MRFDKEITRQIPPAPSPLPPHPYILSYLPVMRMSAARRGLKTVSFACLIAINPGYDSSWLLERWIHNELQSELHAIAWQISLIILNLITTTLITGDQLWASRGVGYPLSFFPIQFWIFLFHLNGVKSWHLLYSQVLFIPPNVGRTMLINYHCAILYILNRNVTGIWAPV